MYAWAYFRYAGIGLMLRAANVPECEHVSVRSMHCCKPNALLLICGDFRTSEHNLMRLSIDN